MFEFNVRPHKYIVINARDTEQCLSFFADVAYDARFGRYGRVIRDVDVSCYSDLAAEQTVLPDEGYDYLSQVTVSAIPVTETENSAGGITVTVGV